MTGEIVSVTVSPASVALPELVTTIWYVTGLPEDGEGGDWNFATVSPTTYGLTVMPDPVPNPAVELHEPDAVAYADVDVLMGVQTAASAPVIVKLKVVPGRKESPVALQA